MPRVWASLPQVQKEAAEGAAGSLDTGLFLVPDLWPAQVALGLKSIQAYSAECSLVRGGYKESACHLPLCRCL